ncbi:unnamed protein product [Soboliphyme baturini]|uniref:Proteasome assembly chaperone 1 n=1 Tax=Soboliphyme baturini TaxID=241478 RepID=A0A183IH11_9BILA|nr:unnamed protein product [Soboliphyme baturini]
MLTFGELREPFSRASDVFDDEDFEEPVEFPYVLTKTMTSDSDDLQKSVRCQTLVVAYGLHSLNFMNAYVLGDTWHLIATVTVRRKVLSGDSETVVPPLAELTFHANKDKDGVLVCLCPDFFDVQASVAISDMVFSVPETCPSSVIVLLSKHESCITKAEEQDVVSDVPARLQYLPDSWWSEAVPKEWQRLRLTFLENVGAADMAMPLERENSISSTTSSMFPEHKVSFSSELDLISYRSDTCEIRKIPVLVRIQQEEQRMYIMLKRLRRSLPNLMTEEQAMMNFVKGMAGTGDLSLPLAFFNAGLWYTDSNITRKNYNDLRCNIPSADYGQTAELAMKQGPVLLRKKAHWGRNTVNTFLMINQIGTICIYYLFISENFKEGFSPSNTMSLIHFMLMILVPLLLLCSIRHLKYLAYFTTVANVILLIAIVILLQYMVRDLPPSSRLPAFNSWNTLPLFFGSAMFAFQGINTISAIESRSLRPKNIIKWNGVLNTSCVLVAVLYIVLGFYGYVKFGDEVKGTVTLNLPMDEPIYRATKVMFGMSILFTYPVQFYVPVSVVARHIEIKYGINKKQFLAEYAFRYLLVLFSCKLPVDCLASAHKQLIRISVAVAAVLPHLGLIISLIGSFAGSVIAMMFPGVIYFSTYHLSNERNFKWYWHLAVTIFLVLIGIFGMVTGSYASIVGLIEALKKGGYS